MYNDQADSAGQQAPQEMPEQMPEQQQSVGLEQNSDVEQDDGIDKRIPKKLRDYMQSKNIAETLSDELKENIANAVVKNTKVDLDSRSEWDDIIEDAVSIVNQVQDGKSYPWEGAANVKFPLLLNAIVQFNARVLPQLVKGDKIVMFDVMKPDPTDEDTQRAERLSAHMSYQLLSKGSHWLMSKDKLLMVVAFCGNAFTKTYRDQTEKNNVVELCLPQDIIVNNGIQDLDTAPRITHRMEKDINYIKSRQNAGEFLDCKLSDLRAHDSSESEEDDAYAESKYEAGEEKAIAAENYESTTEIDYTGRHLFQEQHLWLDLDDDGYQEPYIATVHKHNVKLFRLVARYDETSFVFNDETNKFIKINPIQHFTHYTFIPSYNGGFYGMGFAHMLSPINESVNTIVNLLLDAGTLSNLQSGFIGNGLRIKKGDMRLEPGEWKQIDTKPGSSIKDNIVPLPVKEPSMALFQLLTMLIKAGEEISSVSDVMQGQSPSSGTPATTVINLIQQGMKVFGAILMRLYYSLQLEFEKVYELNKKYTGGSEKYRSAVAAGMLLPGDYQADDYGVFPVADPNLSVDAQSLSKAQTVYQLKEDPNIDAREATERFLEAMKIPNIKTILSPPPDPNAPPPPEVQAELENKAADTKNKNSQAALNLCSIEEMKEKVHLEETKVMIDAYVKGSEVAKNKIESGNSIAMTEAAVGEKAFNQAMQTEEKIEEQEPLGQEATQAIQPPPQPQQAPPPDQQLPEQPTGSPQPQEQPQEAPPPEMPEGAPPAGGAMDATTAIGGAPSNES